MFRRIATMLRIGSVRIVFDVDVKAGRKETLKVRLVPVVE